MKHTTRIRRLLPTAAILLACFCVMTARPAFAGEFDVYGVIEDHTWKEFGDNGQRLLKESGTLFGVGGSYWREFENHITIKPAAEIFGGTVDYTGLACNTTTGVCTPSTTKVDYFGLKLGGDVGRRFRPGENYFLEPFGGLAVRGWDRNIRDGRDANGNATSGYLEEWVTLHARLGARGGYDFAAGKRVFAEAGVKLPLYNENTAYLSRQGLGPDVTLHPGRRPSFFAETGVTVNRFRASLFYDGMRFSRSSEVSGYVQPKSVSDLVGVRLGATF